MMLATSSNSNTDTALPDPPIYTFSYNFTAIDNPDKLPPGLSIKEARQVNTIQKLLKTAYTNEEDDTTQSLQLHKCLMDKNISALKFVCGDLNIMPMSYMQSMKLFKKDWVSEPLSWVSNHITFWCKILY